MALQFKPLAVLAQGLDTVATNNSLSLRLREIQYLLLVFMGTKHIYDIYPYTGKTLIHTK